jgi:hypothetical protein
MGDLSHQFSDWKWACILAFSLLGLAAWVIFGIHPGGFETQVGWLLALLPGAFVVYPLSDHIFKAAPRTEPIMFWTVLIGLNFLWYWAISYVAIKTCRFVARASKS